MRAGEWSVIETWKFRNSDKADQGFLGQVGHAAGGHAAPLWKGCSLRPATRPAMRGKHTLLGKAAGAHCKATLYKVARRQTAQLKNDCSAFIPHRPPRGARTHEATHHCMHSCALFTSVSPYKVSTTGVLLLASTDVNSLPLVDYCKKVVALSCAGLLARLSKRPAFSHAFAAVNSRPPHCTTMFEFNEEFSKRFNCFKNC